MKRRIPFILTLGIVLCLNIYFRSFPVNFPQLKKRAKEITDQVIYQRVGQDIYNKFPQYDPLAKERVIKNRISQYKKFNKQHIKEQVRQGYLQLKKPYQDENNHTYIMELDCWHWGRYVENVVFSGHPGDQIIGGRNFDALMLAPEGSYLNWDQFLHYFSAYLYKFFSLFVRISLFRFLFFLPLFFSAIFIVTLYLFSFRFGKYLGASITCLFVGLAPTFLSRSCAGWFDKDILNFLFPLLVVWHYVLAISAFSWQRRILWLVFSSLWVGLFCFNWTHWWFIFMIIIGYEVISLVFLSLSYFYSKKDKNTASLKLHSFSLFGFVSLSLLWVLIFCRTDPLIRLFYQIKQALILNKPLVASIWPNVLSTVGELRRMSFGDIANSTWGVWIFALSLFCLVVLLVGILLNKKFVGFRRETIIILFIWFASMFFASTRGIRFVVFLLIPLGIALGWAINEIYEYFKNRKQIWTAVFVILVSVGMCSNFVISADKRAATLYPLIDDTWYNLLQLIRDKTPEDTVINSWWDFGDWFKVIAKRKVIFDGQSQDSPQAYWMAKALLSDSEEKAIAILRMLNNGGNKAFEVINKHVKDPLQSVLLLENLLTMEPKKVEEALSGFLPKQAIVEVVRLLFSAPKSNICFVTENTMLGKMGAISYIGNWDFSKVYIAKNFNKKEKDLIIDYLTDLGRDTNKMQQFYQEAYLITPSNLDEWLSAKTLFFSDVVKGAKKDNEVFFPNGFVYNIEDSSISTNTGYSPVSLFIFKEGKLIEKVFSRHNVPFSIFVLETEQGYYNILLDRKLANSMFMRLYFFNGLGLRHFVPFIEAQASNNYIKVFNLVW